MVVRQCWRWQYFTVPDGADIEPPPVDADPREWREWHDRVHLAYVDWENAVRHWDPDRGCASGSAASAVFSSSVMNDHSSVAGSNAARCSRRAVS